MAAIRASPPRWSQPQDGVNHRLAAIPPSMSFHAFLHPRACCTFEGPMLAFTIVVFFLAYVGMALGRLPGLRIDRSAIALSAAVAWLGYGGWVVGQFADRAEI